MTILIIKTVSCVNLVKVSLHIYDRAQSYHLLIAMQVLKVLEYIIQDVDGLRPQEYLHMQSTGLANSKRINHQQIL